MHWDGFEDERRAAPFEKYPYKQLKQVTGPSNLPVHDLHPAGQAEQPPKKSTYNPSKHAVHSILSAESHLAHLAGQGLQV